MTATQGYVCRACGAPAPCDPHGWAHRVPAVDSDAPGDAGPSCRVTRVTGVTRLREGDRATGDLLDALDALLARFVAFPTDHDRHAVAAWVLHAWTHGSWDSTPRLALLSPEKGSGKTRTLEVIELVVPNAEHTVNMSAAAMFRLVGDEDKPITLLMDEADTYLGWKVAQQHEDIRALVNAGHRRGATATRVRMEGGAEVMRFPAYAPVALAGIGDLPDTIIDRSIVIAMKRRSPSERVEQFRRRKVKREVADLIDALAVWAEHAGDDLTALLDVVEMPAGVVDRAADVWEAVIAIGDYAGHPWSGRLRTAASALTTRRAERDPSLGAQLLRDVRTVMDDKGVDRISSVDLATALAAIEGAPWSNLRGNPIDANGIARRVKPFGIRPAVHRFDLITARGYRREDFYDAWERYLPPPKAPVEADDLAPPSAGTRNPRNTGNAPGLGPCRGCDRPATRRAAGTGKPLCDRCGA